MASESQEHLTNGNASRGVSNSENKMKQLDRELKDAIYEAEFHGDMLLGDAQQVVTGYWNDISEALATKNLRSIGSLATTYVTTWGGLNVGNAISAYFRITTPVTNTYSSWLGTSGCRGHCFSPRKWTCEDFSGQKPSHGEIQQDATSSVDLSWRCLSIPDR